MIAARRQGNSATVRLLLDHHANPNPNPHPASESSPLIEAASAADPASIELLIAHGADVKASGEPMLEMAVISECAKCVALIANKDLGKDAYTGALATVAPLGNLSAVRLVLDHGADVNAADPLGRTPLMYAAVSDLLPLDIVKLLVEHGANVNATDGDKNAGDAGLTVLDIAKMHGDTPVVGFLVKAGAKTSAMKPAVLQARQGNTIQSAIRGSIPLIQRADANFPSKAACISCHNDSFAAMAVSAARDHGHSVDEKTAAQQVKANIFGFEKLRDYLHQSIFAPVGEYFGPTVLSYMLIGLNAEHYKPDLNTDTVAMFLKARQFTDGHWPYVAADVRPPICSDYIEQTVLAMRSLQLYAPQTDKAAYDQSIRLAATWIAKSQSRDNSDRVARVLGLAWVGTDKSATEKAVRELLTAQRPDGGWSDLDSMQSSAYATGRSMFALHTAGVPASDPRYQRGVRYLLSTQQEDGSWFVKTRAMAIQPYFDAGFPHGYDQWISAAGTSWATIALSFATPTTLASRK